MPAFTRVNRGSQVATVGCSFLAWLTENSSGSDIELTGIWDMDFDTGDPATNYDTGILSVGGSRAASVSGRVAAATSNRLSRLQPAALLKVDDLENCDPEHKKKATDISQWMI
jgi:hypothetical protein